jgi:hypothetical protein
MSAHSIREAVLVALATRCMLLFEDGGMVAGNEFGVRVTVSSVAACHTDSWERAI